jgi:hypothetical protein
MRPFFYRDKAVDEKKTARIIEVIPWMGYSDSVLSVVVLLQLVRFDLASRNML